MPAHGLGTLKISFRIKAMDSARNVVKSTNKLAFKNRRCFLSIKKRNMATSVMKISIGNNILYSPNKVTNFQNITSLSLLVLKIQYALALQFLVLCIFDVAILCK